MSTWRMAGLNYVNYSNIAAKTLRKSLKSNLKEEAAKRDVSGIRFFYWENGAVLRAFLQFLLRYIMTRGKRHKHYLRIITRQSPELAAGEKPKINYVDNAVK